MILFFSEKKHIFAKIVIFIIELKDSIMILTEEMKKNLPLITEEELKEIMLPTEQLIEIALNDFDEQLRLDEENGLSSNTKLYSD